MRNTLFLVFVSLLFSFLGLKINAQTLLPSGEIPKDLVISLERQFNCFDLSGYKSGKCRNYSLKINADGNVILRLEATRKSEAKNTKSKITQKEIKQLIDFFEKVNFFQFQNEYTDGEICKIRATEQSTETIAIQISGRKKQVEHYLGCYTDEKQITAALLSLGNKIDEIVETERWTGKRK